MSHPLPEMLNGVMDRFAAKSRLLGRNANRFPADGSGVYTREGLEPRQGSGVAAMVVVKMTPVTVESIAQRGGATILDSCSGRDDYVHISLVLERFRTVGTGPVHLVLIVVIVAEPGVRAVLWEGPGHLVARLVGSGIKVLGHVCR